MNGSKATPITNKTHLISNVTGPLNHLLILVLSFLAWGQVSVP